MQSRTSRAPGALLPGHPSWTGPTPSPRPAKEEPESERHPVDKGVNIYLNGSVWWIDIHQDGIRTRKTLGTSNRDKAVAIAKELSSDVLARRWNVSVTDGLTLAKAFEKWKASTEWRNMAPGTKDNTERILGIFLEWLAKESVLLVERVLREHVDRFCRWGEEEYVTPPRMGKKAGAQTKECEGKHVSPTTVNTWISRVSALFGWLMRNQLARLNPAKGIALKVKPAEKKPILPPSAIALLAGFCSPTLLELVIVITEAALRISEAIKLRGADAMAVKGKIRIYNSKGNRYEFIELNKKGRALEIVTRRAEAAGPDGLLFTTAKGTKLCRKNVRRDIIAAAKRAGITTKVTGPHQLRRSGITYAAKKLSPAELTQYARHKDPRTTNQYYVGDLSVISPVRVPAATT